MRSLSNIEIDEYYKGVPQFGGVFCKDQLPKKMNNKCYIINMQDSDEGSGSHWVAVMDVNPKETVYFDSFGENDAPIDIEKFLKTRKKGKKLMRNKIQLQKLDSSSCGEYCIYFVNHAILGNSLNNTLKGFTKNPVINEHILRKYFGQEAFTARTLHKSIKKHKLNGAGIKEVIRYVKNKYHEAKDRVNGFINGPRLNAPPQVRGFLEAHGNDVITNIKVGRKPIMSILEKIAQLLSFGQYEKYKSQMNYDKLFHLFLLVRFSNGQIYKLEKNQVIQIHANAPWLEKNATYENVKITGNITVNSLFHNAEAKVPAKQLYVYHPIQSNCQIFIRDLLASSGLLTTQTNNFIMQNVDAVLNQPETRHLLNIAVDATNLASRADILIHGNGIYKKFKKTRKNKIYT